MKSLPLLEWLRNHDLDRFFDIFEENEVDLPTLRLLTESDLKELGLPFGPRKRILNLLSEENAPPTNLPRRPQRRRANCAS